MTPCIEINARRIGPGYPVYVVAEMSANHNQSFEQAIKIIEAAKEAGADAISVDQLNDMAASRKALPDMQIFGNIDPVAVLANSTEEQVRQAVSSAIAAGVDAIWPGCDLYPPTPLENLQAMMDVACA